MRRILALLVCIILLCGCTEVQQTPQTTPTQEQTEQQLYTMLFNLENKIGLRLEMSDAELEKMQHDYDTYRQFGSKSPIYRMADLYVTITTPQGEVFSYTVEEVGVRMKGNTSRTDFYSREEGIYNLIHLKLSFQETFDDAAYYGADAKQWDESARKERKSRTFATLEKLDLRWNRCDDGTYLKEYFAYETYRAYGVATPRTNLASVQWAGIEMGVYTINEPIDEAFLAKNFPEEALGGDLYKIGWAGNQNGSFQSTASIGIENEDKGEFYAYDLKTNKKTSAHTSLLNLIQELNADVTKEKFAQLVDMDSFLPYCAVSYLLGNPDDLRSNYNNCYIYFRADTGKMVAIPYDFDRCLGVTAHWNPTGNGVTGDDPFSTVMNATGQPQQSPLLLYSVTSGGFFVREYAQCLSDIAASDWFSYETFAKLYAIAQKNYASLTAPGKQFHNTRDLHLEFDLERTSDFSSNGNISIREYLQEKLKNLAYYLQRVDENADAAQPQAPAVWYIRADYTDWAVDEKHTLAEDDGLFVYNAELTKESRLKIFNSLEDEWFGSECVSDACTVSFKTDDHTNIILPPGSYRITIDPESRIITIEEK